MAIWMVTHRFQVVIHGVDAMRLVQVRDLLDGQPWYDLAQHRLGAGEGRLMLLSRLVDIPIAGLILLFDVFVPRAQAETIMMFVWPGTLFAMTVACLHTICHRLGGPSGAVYGTILASILLCRSGQFEPGSIGQHNVEMTLLAVAIVGFIMRRPRWPFALIGGMSVALSIAIGGAMVVQIAAVCLVFGSAWAFRGAVERVSLLIFASSFAGLLCLGFALGAPADAYEGGFCNALSVDLALPAFAGAGGLFCLAYFMSNRRRRSRLIGLSAVILLVAALVAALGQSCFSDPFANADPLANMIWLDRVTEYQSVAEFSARDLGTLFGCFVGWIISVWFVARDIRRDPWMLLCALLTISLVMTVYHARPQAVMLMLSVLPSAVLASRLALRKNADTNVWSDVAAISILLLSLPFLTATMASMREAAAQMNNGQALTVPLPANGTACSSAKAFRGLKSLPAGVVVAPVALGPYILLHTPHRILSVSQRQDQGARIGAASYVIQCNDDPDFAADNPALASYLESGLEAGTLEPVPAKRSRGLSVYRRL